MNLPMPWDKKDKDKGDIVKPVSIIQAFLQVKRGGESFTFQPLWHIMLGTQAISLDWNSELDLISVSLDNGKIMVVEFSPMEPTKYDRIFFEKVHSKRVMMSHIHTAHKCVYSISEDMNLVKLNPRLEENNIISSRNHLIK